MTLEQFLRSPHFHPIGGGASAPFEIITGPADVWVSPVGTAFPASPGVAPAVAWLPMGYTDGGVTITHTQTINQYRVDQVQGPVKAMRAEEGNTIGFAIAQLTMERYAQVINNAAVVTSAGPPAIKTMKLEQGVDIATFAMLIRFPSPYFNGYADYQLPIVYESADPAVTYGRDNMSTLSSEWTQLADTTKAKGDRMGQIVAQTA
jgi:hypothetical protein